MEVALTPAPAPVDSALAAGFDQLEAEFVSEAEFSQPFGHKFAQLRIRVPH